MTVQFQASLFDSVTESGTPDSAPGATRGPTTPSLGGLGETVRRHALSRGAWVDVRPGWVSGADDLFADLVGSVPWQAERRQMYERVVDVPRLLRFYAEGEPLPHPALAEAREALSRHYRGELGEDFTTAGMCYYRDGRDSVAWHGDRVGRRHKPHGSLDARDTMVAIVSLGEARKLALRPRNGEGGSSGPLGFWVGHGDLLVMGGSCQRTWEHAVLKTAKPVGPRISVQFRPHNVR